MPTTLPPVRFHWSPRCNLRPGDTAQFFTLCDAAEAAGMDSMHVPIANPLSDALTLAAAASHRTTRLSYRIGWSLGDVIASLRGQDLKNTWNSLGGRLIVHLVLDGEESSVNGNILSANEFVANCRSLFQESPAPHFDVQGETAEAAFLAIKQGNCLWRLPNRPNQVYGDAVPVLHFGKEAGLLCFVIAGETRDDALQAASGLLPAHPLKNLGDSEFWITPYLWIGNAPGIQERAAVLLGSFEEVARAILTFRENGISQFLFKEWPRQKANLCVEAKVIQLTHALTFKESADK